MSSDLPALIRSNEMALPEPEQRRLVRLYQEKSISYLAPDKELGPFLLYSVGDSLETIAVKCNLPKDVVLLTAIHYKWNDKVKFLQKDGLDPIFMQKEISNTLLVATYKSMMDDLGAVIAGKKAAKDVGLIPKNMVQLQNLMDMVTKLNAPKEVAPSSTVIHAQQVQVNNNNQLPGTPVQEVWEIKVDDPKRKAMLKAIDE